ncbi:hypothetical protein QL285_087065 [Trifolium repens]|nr:hypothetical protein QL285_087065 [Trifolium repens]
MGSRFPPILQGSPKDFFMTVHIPNEIFGEIDPFFIATHFRNLGSRWNLYDPDGIPHQIDFNRSLLNPLITFGWPRIRHYYQWTGVKRLSFHYYGEDTFLMCFSEGRGNISPASFPPFHNLSTNRGDYRSFQMTMTESNVNSSNLILSEEFANWIQHSEYSKIKLSGPLNHFQTLFWYSLFLHSCDRNLHYFIMSQSNSSVLVCSSTRADVVSSPTEYTFVELAPIPQINEDVSDTDSD